MNAIYYFPLLFLSYDARKLSSIDLINSVLSDFSFEFAELEDIDVGITDVEFTSPLICENFQITDLNFIQTSISNEEDYELITNQVSLTGLQFNCAVDTRARIITTTRGQATVDSESTSVSFTIETLSKDYSRLIPTIGRAPSTACDEMISIELEIDLEMDSLLGNILGIFVNVFSETVSTLLEDALCPTMQGLAGNISNLVTDNVLVDMIGEREDLSVFNVSDIENALGANLSEDYEVLHVEDFNLDRVSDHLWSEFELSPFYVRLGSAFEVLRNDSDTGEGLANGLEKLIYALFSANITLNGEDFEEIVQTDCYIELRENLLEGYFEVNLFACSGLEEVYDDAMESLEEFFEENPEVEYVLLILRELVFESNPSQREAFLMSLLKDILIDIINSTELEEYPEIINFLEFILSFLSNEYEYSETDVPFEYEFASDKKNLIEYLENILNSTLADLLEEVNASKEVVEILDFLFDLNATLVEIYEEVRSQTFLDLLFDVLDVNPSDYLPGNSTFDPSTGEFEIDLDLDEIIDKVLNATFDLLNSTFPELYEYLTFYDELEFDFDFRAFSEKFLTLTIPLGDFGNLTTSPVNLLVRAKGLVNSNSSGVIGNYSYALPTLNLDDFNFLYTFNLTLHSTSMYTDVISLSFDLGLIYSSLLSTAFSDLPLLDFGFQKLKNIFDAPVIAFDFAMCTASGTSFALPAQTLQSNFSFETLSEGGDFEGIFLDIINGISILYGTTIPSMMELALPMAMSALADQGFDPSTSWISFENPLQPTCFRNPVFIPIVEQPEEYEDDDNNDVEGEGAGISMTLAAILPAAGVAVSLCVLSYFGIIPAAGLISKLKGGKKEAEKGEVEVKMKKEDTPVADVVVDENKEKLNELPSV
eukprot:augustus_masked-scaffold_16-processed-gene-6.6-mRNA-1 protein AED:1.00 eAED:1.00 QI:0/-1/0/0/-1/1/1/0/880